LAKKLLKIILRDKQLFFGVIGLLTLLFMTVAAPMITAGSNPAYYGPDMLNAPGENGHFLGTNKLGQDIFTMLVYGVRTSLMVGVGSALISGVLGVVIGGVAGYFGGWLDKIVQELINVFLMLPYMFLILLIVAMFGNSLSNVMIVIGITTWPSNAKLMRAQALSIKERTFVKGSIAMGESNTQILYRYIIPNGIFPVIANTTSGMAGAILSEAGLSFLGLGDPTVISWGQMIEAGRSLITTAWWITFFPGLIIVFTVMTFFLLGDGLNHVLNPKHASGGSV